MGNIEASGSELQEIREDILETNPHPQSIDKKLVYDGKQYSLKFPKKFIEEADIDLDKDLFEINLELPDPLTEDKPKLSATLKRKNAT